MLTKQNLMFLSQINKNEFKNLTLEKMGRKLKVLETIFTTKTFKFVGINIDENLSLLGSILMRI